MPTHLAILRSEACAEACPQALRVLPPRACQVTLARRGCSILLTGGAGTGKSFTLRAIIQAGVIDNGIPHSGMVSGDR